LSASRIIPAPEDLLARLVRCPSTGGPAGCGEEGMVALLADLLEPWASEIEIARPAAGRPNLVARFEGRDTSRSYALEAHSDTVSAAGMTIDPFSGEVRDGKLFGRGACDTKGPMASMLLALMNHLREHGKPAVTWYFVASCDEESGALGARDLVRRGFRCDGMVVGEPTLLRPVGSHKGCVRHRVAVRGLAAHSSTPERGANAIHAAAAFITQAEAEVQASAARCGEGGKAVPTFSTGIIRGGDQVNSIPDDVSFETDYRLPPGMEAGEVERFLENVAMKVAADRPSIDFRFERTQSYPAFHLAADSMFRRVIAPLCEGGWHKPATYATNAGIYAAAGIPCVVFGPGDMALAHTAEEHIALDQIAQGAVLLGRCVAAAR
jgi:acetylornithine deacetylase/succinyl-diaminopimelate desuccinylase-like protein